MNQAVPQRVRITHPRMSARRRGPIRPIASEIDEQTPLGEVYLNTLIGSQRRLAIRVSVLASVLLGGLPLLFRFVPWTTTTQVFGLPLPWVVLGVGVYPVMLLLGWWAVRGAERYEQEFAELVERD